MSGGIEVIFLGTGGSLPTKERGLPSVALRRDGEIILFDCGEGTQRQMMHTGLGFNRPTVILISHLHGDHILGLPGLLQTMSSLARDKPLDLYGPKGLMRFLELIYKPLDRKSTRLNSSHRTISYAVFCLKKKKKKLQNYLTVSSPSFCLPFFSTHHAPTEISTLSLHDALPILILISHLHGDHILGLPGLLQTMSSLARDKPLDLYGPKGLMRFLELIYKP